MSYRLARRAVLIGAMATIAASAMPALAQDKPVLRFSAVFSEQDIRAQMTKMFSEDIQDIATLEPYYGGNLFKQGTELVALQRGNLEMGNIAPQDVSKQIPAWSVLTSAYLFRDAAHLRTFFDSALGAEFKKMAEDQLGMHILGPPISAPAGRPEARQEDHHSRRHGRHQASHAGRRRLAVSRLGAGCKPHADGLCRGLHRAPDRRDRRPGQPLAQYPKHEVLRGDVADRPDLPPHRFRSLVDLEQVMECDDARAASQDPGSVRQGHRMEHRATSGPRGQACGRIQGEAV